ncbi:unnamed protein product [Caenorhabditis sp. 36 PRJEB53466]|nr:unnamed protein product [Caenorhabditis sp. 36 PRJEB53466]
MPKRNDDALDELERNFVIRVIEKFSKQRSDKLENQSKDFARFLGMIKTETIMGEQDRRYVTLTRLVKILAKMPETIREFLPHSTVSALVKMTNFNMTIDIALIEYLVRTVEHSERTYIKLLDFSENSREISCMNLETYIKNEYIPTMVEEVENAEYYAAFAAGIIFFILGARKKELISIQDLLASTLLLCLEDCIQAENGGFPLPAVDIFTVKAFRETICEFRDLDTDRNGVLSPQELLRFRGGLFNEVFIERIFQISQTYENCIDFKGFVDLVCAVDFRHTRASAKYHFEAFDLQDDGLLDGKEIRTMTILQAYVTQTEEPLNFDPDVIDCEMRDLLQLTKPITPSEFADSKIGHLFSGFVSNFRDMQKYEAREQ